MCFSPQRRAIFRHLNFKKCAKTQVFCTFWLTNVLLATAACNFFDIGTSKSAPRPSVFLTFCFSPQRRAIFRHRNGKKWSGPDVFCTFSLENVLLATAACNFSTSELPNVVRSWRVLYIFTWKRTSRHSGVQFLISPLTTWLRTRRFNEPTFRLTRHTNHWKNTAFRDFSNIWRGWIFFLLTFALLQLLSSDFTSSSDFTFLWLYFIYLLFICFSTLHTVGSLLFKLPSMKISETDSNASGEWNVIVILILFQPASADHIQCLAECDLQAFCICFDSAWCTTRKVGCNQPLFSSNIFKINAFHWISLFFKQANTKVGLWMHLMVVRP